MSKGQLIHDKLIADFKTFTFSSGGTLFNNVEKFFATSTMKSSDCLILPDSNEETVQGNSAGNYQTTRAYNFRAFVVENIETSASNSEGSLKYSRLMNSQDAILDYLQKEPSNLNAWGQLQTPKIEIFKIRITNTRFDTLETKNGYSAILDISFGIFLNVIPQNL